MEYNIIYLSGGRQKSYLAAARRVTRVGQNYWVFSSFSETIKRNYNINFGYEIAND